MPAAAVIWRSRSAACRERGSKSAGLLDRPQPGNGAASWTALSLETAAA